MLIVQKHLQAITRALTGKEVAPIGELLDKIDGLVKQRDALLATSQDLVNDAVQIQSGGKSTIAYKVHPVYINEIKQAIALCEEGKQDDSTG